MSSSKQIVECTCGAKLRIPENAAGRRIKCPKCENRIQIPADDAPSNPAPTTEPGKGVSLLDDFMQLESGAETAAGPDLEANQDACPSCKTPIAKGAMTCLMCGWEKGKPAKPSADDPGTKSVARKFAVGGSRFALGCTFSALGALLGAAIWYGLAIATDYEIGYVAVALGFFAGFGMLVGYGQQDLLAAVVATAMALAGILAGKWFIYDHYVGDIPSIGDPARAVAVYWADRKCSEPFHRQGLPDWADECINACVDVGDEIYALNDTEYKARHTDLEAWGQTQRWEDPEYARVVLTMSRAQEAWESQGGFGDEDDPWDEAAEIKKYRTQYEKARTTVNALEESKRIEQAKRAEAEAERNIVSMHEDLAELMSENSFFESMFSPIDGLFVIFALGTAMKVGGGFGGDE